MKRIIVSALTMLTFLAGPVQAGDIEFRSAYHTEWRTGTVRTQDGGAAIVFDEFSKNDWEKLAKAHFKAFPLKNLSAAQIQELTARKNMFGNVEFHYVAPLPEPYKNAKFVLLSAKGIRSLKVTGLRGTVRYRMRGTNQAPSMVFYGKVLGVPEPNNAFSGGIVALLKDGQKLLSENLVGPILPRLATASPYKKLEIKQQIRYRLAGTNAAYLFVQYGADTACEAGCCEFRYYLFREDAKTLDLKQVRASEYGCDI